MPRSISRALTLSLIITISIVAMFGIMSMYVYQMRQAETELKMKADEHISYLVNVLRAPLWVLDYEMIEVIGENISKYGLIANLVIKREDGRVIYFLEKVKREDLVERSIDIFRKDKLLGSVDCALTKEPYQTGRRHQLQLFFMATLLTIIVLICATGFFIKVFLNKPLAALDKTVKSYAQGRYDSTPVQIPYLEFKPFGRVLAQMGATIKEQLTSLHELNTQLEQRVIERTAELAKAKEAAEVASQAKSAFLANMSHELRTPLNAILGYAQLMQRESSLPPQQRKYLKTINRSGEHLLALINAVLEISKIEAGQLTLESTTFDLHALFRDLENMIDSSLDAKGLYFEIMGMDEVPRYAVTDENKLRQVLVNLLGNGVKFTERGGITVRVAVAVAETAEAERVERIRLAVEVQDTGRGIAVDELDKVFAHFEQTASGRAQKSGTGLGLAISREFVRMMGGDISVTSKEGEGSTFGFEIDIGEGCQKVISAKAESERLVIGLAPEQEIPRILVAEDMEESRTLLVQLLTMVGFEVQAAANGKAALERFHQFRPDFIWMDIRMPEMDGLAATRRIKESEAGKSTVVAALTAHALEEEKERILAAGCDDFVRKPFQEQEIFEVMAKHLGLKYVYEEAQEAVEPVAPTVELRPEQLSALPEDLLSRLHGAAVELDVDRILSLVESIKTIDAHMATALETSAKKFALGPLLELLKKIDQSKHGDNHD